MKPYAVGTSILDVMLKALRELSVRWLKDNITTAMFINSLEITVEALHKKAAKQANQKVQKHLQKALEISERWEKAKAVEDSKWNDDKL